jgi:hypothetical protein
MQGGPHPNLTPGPRAACACAAGADSRGGLSCKERGALESERGGFCAKRDSGIESCLGPARNVGRGFFVLQNHKSVEVAGISERRSLG